MKNKSMWILGGITLILFVAVVVACVKILFYPSGKGIYGNRLDDIENYSISDEKISEIKTSVVENEECESMEFSSQGKILKFFLKVSDDVGSTSAQRLGDNIIDSFSETELGYYDVSIYITSASNIEPYPMIGYKSKDKSAISWTLNKGELDEE